METLINIPFADLAIALAKLLLAAVLGGVVGWERERHGRWAGFRTHILVSLGACLMMLVSEFIQTRYSHIPSETVIRMDPSRVAAQIVTGIGFLGAGAIIKSGANMVRGLTTAACLWVVAGIGMAIGCGYIVPALATVVLALITLLALNRLDSVIRAHNYKDVIVEAKGDCDVLGQIRDTFAGAGLVVKDVGFDLDKDRDRTVYELSVRYTRDEQLLEATRKSFAEIPKITRLKFM